jgi:hypothetical protein
MFDEMDRLAEVKELFLLLVHYGDQVAADRETWQDRLSEMPGVDARRLVALHGELIAYGWLEQNTGMTPVLQPGTAAQCYRVSSAGLRTLKQAQAENMHAA